jgi:hypothetical protein
VAIYSTLSVQLKAEKSAEMLSFSIRCGRLRHGTKRLDPRAGAEIDFRMRGGDATL